MATLATRPLKVSALHRRHLSLGARWTEEAEWRVPDSFADPRAEAEWVRQGVGLQDASAIGKLDLSGRDVEQLLAGFALPGRVLTLRLTPDRVLLLTAPGGQEPVAEALLHALSRPPCCVHLTDLTSALSAFVLVGPKASELLAKLTALDLRPGTFPDGACAEAGLANVHAIIIRDDWGSLLAYRLLLGRELGEYGWEAIHTAGRNLGLVPFGRSAERFLRGGP